MVHLNYDRLFAKAEYDMIINHLVKLINIKFYSKMKAGWPLKLQVVNIVKGIIYVLITGCQWNMISKEFGNSSSILNISWNTLDQIYSMNCGQRKLMTNVNIVQIL